MLLLYSSVPYIKLHMAGDVVSTQGMAVGYRGCDKHTPQPHNTAVCYSEHSPPFSLCGQNERRELENIAVF